MTITARSETSNSLDNATNSFKCNPYIGSKSVIESPESNLAVLLANSYRDPKRLKKNVFIKRVPTGNSLRKREKMAKDKAIRDGKAAAKLVASAKLLAIAKENAVIEVDAARKAVSTLKVAKTELLNGVRNKDAKDFLSLLRKEVGREAVTKKVALQGTNLAIIPIHSDNIVSATAKVAMPSAAPLLFDLIQEESASTSKHVRNNHTVIVSIKPLPEERKVAADAAITAEVFSKDVAALLKAEVVEEFEAEPSETFAVASVADALKSNVAAEISAERAANVDEEVTAAMKAELAEAFSRDVAARLAVELAFSFDEVLANALADVAEGFAEDAEVVLKAVEEKEVAADITALLHDDIDPALKAEVAESFVADVEKSLPSDAEDALTDKLAKGKVEDSDRSLGALQELETCMAKFEIGSQEIEARKYSDLKRRLKLYPKSWYHRIESVKPLFEHHFHFLNSTFSKEDTLTEILQKEGCPLRQNNQFTAAWIHGETFASEDEVAATLCLTEHLLGYSHATWKKLHVRFEKLLEKMVLGNSQDGPRSWIATQRELCTSYEFVCSCIETVGRD